MITPRTSLFALVTLFSCSSLQAQEMGCVQLGNAAEDEWIYSLCPSGTSYEKHYVFIIGFPDAWVKQNPRYAVCDWKSQTWSCKKSTVAPLQAVLK